jgi:hypothetical protein
MVAETSDISGMEGAGATGEAAGRDASSEADSGGVGAHEGVAGCCEPGGVPWG